MTEPQAPQSALQAVRQYLDAINQIMTESNERSISQIAALVVKAGGRVRLEFDEIAALNRETHLLEIDMDDTGMTLAWKERLPQPAPKKKSNLVGLNGQPLGGA